MDHTLHTVTKFFPLYFSDVSERGRIMQIIKREFINHRIYRHEIRSTNTTIMQIINLKKNLRLMSKNTPSLIIISRNDWCNK